MNAISLSRRPFACRAFTLIELLVVVLVIGILVAVAAPTFLGQTAKAQNSAVEQQMMVARKEAKMVWTWDGGAYCGGQLPACDGAANSAALGTQTTPGTVLYALHAAEPQLSFAPGPTSSSGTGTASASVIDVTLPDANTIAMCQASASGAVLCFEAQESSGSLTSEQTSAPASLAPSFAQAASRADMLYSTGVSGASAQVDESIARCPLNAALPSADTTYTQQLSICPIGGYTVSPVSWEAPSASSGAGAGSMSAPTFTSAPALSALPPAPLSAESVGYAALGSPTPVPSYQWYDCNSATAVAPGVSGQAQSGICNQIAGASLQTYTPQSADVGQYLTVVVTEANFAGVIASQATPALVDSVPSGGVANISGSATVGQTLTGATSGWSGTPASYVYTYQWEDCTSTAETSCTPASGSGASGTTSATSATYTLQSSDAGSYMVYEVKAANAAGTSSYALSAAMTPAVIAAPTTPQAAFADSVNAQSSLVSYFPMTQSAGLANSVSGAPTLTNQSAALPTSAAGPFQGSGYVSATGCSSSCMSLASDPVASDTTFTFEGWFDITSTSTADTVFATSSLSNGYCELDLGYGTEFMCYSSSTGWEDAYASSSFPLNGWHFLALTEGAGGAVTLYVDGVTDGTGSFGTLNPTTTQMNGSLSIGTGQRSYDFAGEMSNLAFYSGALSGSTIAAQYASFSQQQLFFANSVNAQSSLVSYFPMTQSAGLANSVSGAPTLTNQSAALPTSAAGPFQGSGYVSATGCSSSCMSLASDPVASDTTFTFEGWFDITSTSTADTVFATSSLSNGYCELDLGYGTEFMCYSSSTGWEDAYASSSFPLNGWHFLALTEGAGGAVTLYVDGVTDGTGSFGTLNPTTTQMNGSLSIGTGQRSYDFAGEMSNLAFYSGALSGSTIAAQYADG